MTGVSVINGFFEPEARKRIRVTTAMTTQATENAAHLATATEEFANSSGEIGRQVREAGTLTDDAGTAAAAAG